VSDARDAQADPSEEALHYDATRWREARAGCPDPDLLLARDSELLEPALRTALALHVETCDACARFEADIAALDLDEPDRDVEARVLARARDPEARSSRWRIPLAAVVVLACGGALAWWLRSPPPAAPVAPLTASAPTSHPAAAAPVVALWAIDPLPVRVPMSSLGVPRSGGPADEAGDALSNALVPYQAGRYGEAISSLERMLWAQPGSADAALYLGVTYLLADRPADAHTALERAAALAGASRRDDVAWYRATAEQRTGRTEAARSRLHALCLASGEYRIRACAAEQALR